MTISIPSLTGTDFASVANYASAGATNLAGEIADLINDLRVLGDSDYTSIEDFPTLTANEVNFDEQLADVRTRLPVFAGGYDVVTLMDRLAAVLVPSTPELNDVSVDTPDFAGAPPTITLPELPVNDVGAAPTDMPALADAALPDAPSITLPNVPTFEEFSLPGLPSYDLPTFSAEAPVNLIAAPTTQFDFVDSGYTSTLRDPLVAKLLDGLTNGGYGIEPADEQALWDRARDRETKAANARIAEIRRQAAATSFPMPQGPLFAMIQQAQQELHDKLASASREVALKRAELYVENRRFTIEQVQQHEKVAIDLYNAIQERALNAAKASVEMAVAVYDASVRNFAVQLDAYKAEAAVFEQRVRGELAKAELFKAQLQAESLRMDFNKNKVAIYVAQLDGIKAAVELYRSRMQAVQTFTEIQGQKLDMFKTRVVAYAERVKAKEAEFGMYRSAVMGQLAKLDVFKSEIDAYNATLQGKELKTNVTLKANEVLMQRFNAEVKAYEEELRSASTRINAGLEIGKTDVALYQARVAGYRALADTMVESVRTRIENLKVNNEQSKAVLQSRVAKLEHILKKQIATVENNKDVNVKAMDVLRTMLGALLSNLSGITTVSA